MNVDQSPPFKVLFLCTGNGARSILAEPLMRRMGKGRFKACSAGSEPAGHVNPFALCMLRDAFRIDASDARSKSWDGFRSGAFDFVLTVCDHAAETCPAWPGQPVVAHGGVPDPAAFHGSEETCRYPWKVVQLLSRRVDLLCCLPFRSLDRLPPEQATRDVAWQENAL